MRSIESLGFAKSALFVMLAGALGSGALAPGNALAHGRKHVHERPAASPSSQTPQSPIEAGARALTEHRFREALDLGRAARAAARDASEEAAALAIIVDACVEIGRYDAAIDTLQVLVDAHPGLAAFARVSYVRELHGDLAGAADAMREAARLGRDAEEIAWCHAKLGELELLRGDFAAAEREASSAIAVSPGYADAGALLARLCAARGDWNGAATHYREAISHRADPGFFAGLGDVQEATGDTVAASASYDTARRLLMEDAEAGTDVDLELLALEIEHAAHGMSAIPLADLLRRARALRERRPTIFADAILAELLARDGNAADALAAAERATSLGSRDPSLLVRAAVAYRSAGDIARAAQLLDDALNAQAALGPRRALEARTLLAELRG